MRAPESDVEKIAVMRDAGAPFDFAVALSIDWQDLADDITARQLTGQLTADYIRPVEQLALIALAYYSPRHLGIDVDELESPVVDAEILEEEDPS